MSEFQPSRHPLHRPLPGLGENHLLVPDTGKSSLGGFASVETLPPNSAALQALLQAAADERFRHYYHHAGDDIWGAAR